MSDGNRFKYYLGDGVYVDYSGGQIILKTRISKIILEEDVFLQLVAYQKRVTDIVKEELMREVEKAKSA